MLYAMIHPLPPVIMMCAITAGDGGGRGAGAERHCNGDAVELKAGILESIFNIHVTVAAAVFLWPAVDCWETRFDSRLG